MYYEIIGDLSPIIKYLWRICTVPFCTFQVFNNKHIYFFMFIKVLEVLINPTTFTYIIRKQEQLLTAFIRNPKHL